jgi:two-component system sensor histidine kinase BarA
LLAVDDDQTCRQAVSSALRKAFPAPDLAENGTKALELANQHTYDVVFLDVEMPDLDGFAVCSGIHETVKNRNTPVVFVTSHSDFNSRTKSTASGGRDLIAKPFLGLEVTVKALTWLFRSRMERGNVATAAAPAASSKQAVALKP